MFEFSSRSFSAMSPSDSQVGLKNYPALELDFPLPDVESDAHLAQSEADALQALKLEPSNETLGSITAAHAHDLGDASHFGDFQFPYQNSLEDSPMVGLPSSFDDHGPDVFGASEPTSISGMQDRQDSVASITVQTSAYGAGANAGGQRQHSMEGSDEGTPDSNQNGGNSLEEPMSDEFGLARGPVDGSDLGGKSKGEKADTTPAWSELKTKAGKERKRLPLACIACRRKKIRCSGEKPACKHCLRSRIPCVYKVTARKAAPRTDYMAMLDKRLKRMEERIIKIVPRAEQDGLSSTVTRAVVKPAIPGTLNAGKSAAKKRGADEAFGPDLEHWARAAPKSKLEGPNRPSTILVQEAEESKLLLEGGDALPSKELQEHLAEVFFENIYGQAYHILHKPSFMRKLKYVSPSVSPSKSIANQHPWQSWRTPPGSGSLRLRHRSALFQPSQTEHQSKFPARRGVGIHGTRYCHETVRMAKHYYLDVSFDPRTARIRDMPWRSKLVPGWSGHPHGLCASAS